MRYTLTTLFTCGHGWTASFDTRPDAITAAFHFFGLAAPPNPTEEHALKLFKAVTKNTIGTFTIKEIAHK